MAEQNKPYRVLARKYRPQNFDELIGQDALVRTLKNAITSGRIAHAFMLTGVRGVGKTTTARIIAKALNYTGPDGTAGPTTGKTDDCSLCKAISEDRHPDVIEMDAASRTGVDDIREILDGVRYAPTEARYKIYVIDEVHMLSKNAFNALLKTLEEPPEHVKFIFATTEIRKVPITVLSRCQRFDLQRVGADLLIPHFMSICEKEGVQAEHDAIAMIARAADGSVRDGLSLLDQAIALSGEAITAQQVQDMLGLADRAQNLDLLESALSGNIAGALEIMDGVYKNGGAPNVVLQDLLDLTHTLTKFKAAPSLAQSNQSLSGDMLARARDLSTKLSMPSLGKAWQILMRGLPEVHEAPNPQAAAEMVIIRLAYAADLPDPADLIKRIKDNPALGGQGHTLPQAGTSHFASSAVHHQDFTPAPQTTMQMTGTGTEIAPPRAAPVLRVVEAPEAIPTMKTMEEVITFLNAHQEIVLGTQLYHFAHPVKIEHKNYGDAPSGRIEFRQNAEAIPDLAGRLKKTLNTLTGQNWMITLVSSGGGLTVHEEHEAARLHELEEVAKAPLVQAILTNFPNATLTRVHAAQEETHADTNDQTA